MTHSIVRITSEIHQVGGFGLTHPDDAAIYLVNFAGQAALIDAGSGGNQSQLLANIHAAGVTPEQIRYLLLTHCHFDHTGGARSLREQLGCPSIAHVLDAEFLEIGDDEVTAASWYGTHLTPFTVDQKLTAPRTEILLGDRVITALHIPGHSPGSVAYLTASEGQTVVFAQDVHGPLHPALRSNTADYVSSLRELLDLQADILCEGHYGIFTGQSAMRRFILSFLNRF
ncbi:MAG: MBL fold metallo-hydrolase [Candidatus Competibacteraceae bacterium]